MLAGKEVRAITTTAVFNLPLSEYFLAVDTSPRQNYLDKHAITAWSLPCTDCAPDKDTVFDLIERIMDENPTDQRRTMLVFGPHAHAVAAVVRGATPQAIGPEKRRFCYQYLKTCREVLTCTDVAQLAEDFPCCVMSGDAIVPPSEDGGLPMFPSAVLPRLFLGSQLHAQDEEVLRLLGIESVVNATELVPNYFEAPPANRRYLRLAIRDEPKQNMAPAFHESHEFIARELAAGRKVLVHCVEGKSRSAALVINHLLESGGCGTLPEAVALTVQARKIAKPNNGFLMQLLFHHKGRAAEAGRPKRTAKAEGDTEKYAAVTLAVEACLAENGGDFPGMAVAVVQDGEARYWCGAGVLRRGGGAAAGNDAPGSDGAHAVAPGAAVTTSQTMFVTASISKTVLAAVCLQCVERGELDLDAGINTYLASGIANPHFPTAQITPRHLLTHSAGLVDDESALEAGSKWRTAGQDSPFSLAEYVAERLSPASSSSSSDAAAAGGLWSSRAAPGEAAYHYSNAGFTLLAHVVECAAKKPLKELARERVFEPLGMLRTSYSIEEASGLAHTSVACPHDASGAPIGVYGVAEWPAALMMSTAEDLARYMSALTRPTPAQPCTPAGAGRGPILSDASLGMMLPSDFKRGLAWWGKDAQ